MGYSKRRKKGDYSKVPKSSGIYRLYHGDRVVYVGETRDLRRRQREHESGMGWWGSNDYKGTKGVPKSKERGWRVERGRKASRLARIDNISRMSFCFQHSHMS